MYHPGSTMDQRASGFAHDPAPPLPAQQPHHQPHHQQQQPQVPQVPQQPQQAHQQQPQPQQQHQQQQEKLSSEDAEGEAVQPPPQLEIPTPPPSRQFKTFQELQDSLQAFFRENGAALVTARSSKPKEVNGVRVPTNVTLICDRGKLRPPRGTGIRKTSTAKTGCPFKITASFKVSENNSWTYRIACPTHNHFQSTHPSAHVIHRRRTPAQRALAATLSKFPALSAQDVADAIKDLDGQTFILRKDLYNDRQRLKRISGKGVAQVEGAQLASPHPGNAQPSAEQAGLAPQPVMQENNQSPAAQQVQQVQQVQQGGPEGPYKATSHYRQRTTRKE